MKEKFFVICDSDEAYLTGLQNYLVKKKLADFEFYSFGKTEQLKVFMQEHCVEILLIEEKLYEEIEEDLQARKVFLLTEEKQGKYTSLYKYQSIEKLLRSVLDGYAKEEGCRCKEEVKERTTKLITFYSPEGNGSQTLAALATGQALAEKDKVLYLNLAAFSGLERLLGVSFDADLSDVLYFAMKHSERLIYKLEALKKNISGLEYIPPARNPRDVAQVNEEQWEAILGGLLDMGEYRYILMEVTDACQGLLRILERSERIYTLYGESEGAHARLEEYKAYFESVGRQAILEKTGFVPEPMVWKEKKHDYAELMIGHPGKYMKGILYEDGIL